MNPTGARLVLWIGAALVAAACGGARTTETHYSAGGGGGDEGGGERVGGGRFAKADVEHALAAAKTSLAALDQKILAAEEATDPKDADGPVRLAAMRADRTAGAAYAADLAACLTDPAACPASLDEPTVPADFDPATGEVRGDFTAAASKWPEVAAQLEREACGCRTAVCTQWVLADLTRWEAGLPPAAQDDEAAATHVVGARECLWTRLGRRVHRAPTAPAADATADE